MRTIMHSPCDTKGVRSEFRVALCLIVLIAFGAGLVTALATVDGPTVYPDGVTYLRVADGLTPIEHPPGHFPEGYPVTLRALQAINLGPLDAGRWLGVGLAAVDIVLAGLVAMRMARPLWAVAVALALATAATILPLYAGLYSEPLFIAFLLGWLLLADSPRPDVLAAAGVLASGAFLVRFAGVAFLIAGVLVLRSERRRVLAFVGGAALPLIMWGAARFASIGVIDRHTSWHPPSGGEVTDAVARTPAWMTGNFGSPRVGSLVIVAAMLLLLRVRRLPGSRAIGLAAASYAVVLGVTVVVLDAQTPLNARLFAPLQVLVILSLPAISTLPGRGILLAGVACSVALNASATRQLLDPLDTGMLELANAPTVIAARNLHGVVASNAAGALWLLNGTEIRWIPKVTDPYTAQPTSDFAAAMNRLRGELAGGGHLVWLDAYDYRGYLPTEEQVVRELGAVLEERFPEGAIYTVPS